MLTITEKPTTNFKEKDFIYAVDENAVLQIKGFVKGYSTQMIDAVYVAHGGTRWFEIDATHIRKATQEEIQNELSSNPKYYPYWIADKKNTILAAGKIRALSVDRAQEIFNKKLAVLKTENHVGEYFLSTTPDNYILQ